MQYIDILGDIYSHQLIKVTPSTETILLFGTKNEIKGLSAK